MAACAAGRGDIGAMIALGGLGCAWVRPSVALAALGVRGRALGRRHWLHKVSAAGRFVCTDLVLC